MPAFNFARNESVREVPADNWLLILSTIILGSHSCFRLVTIELTLLSLGLRGFDTLR